LSKKYILTPLLFLICCAATAQIMLPAYQGVFSKNTISASGPGNALDFNGSNDRVNSTNDVKFQISVGTIEGWIKTGNAGSSYCGAFGKTFAYFLYLYNNELIVYDWGGGGNRSTGITLNDNTWHHIAMSFNSGVNNGTLIYIDGVLKLTTTMTIASQDQPFTIGGVVDPYNQFYTGSIDDVRIWNVARTQPEIQANMNNELNGTETGLVAYYTFNQGIAGGNNTAISIVTDKTANALNGTLTNFSKNGLSSNFVTGRNFIGPNAIISNGLVLHLDAGNVSSYPGSGNTWTDLSGNGYNGTLTNGPTFSSSNGGTIVFDGTNDVASFGNILNMGLSSWTLSCWVKFNVGSGFAGIMGKTSYRGYVGRYSFYIDNGDIYSFFQPNNNYIITTPITPYLDNKFHNLVMTIDRTSMMYFYVDGVSVGTPVNVGSTSTINLNSSTDNFYIGSYGSSNGLSPYAFLNGNVSQVAIYNRALIAAEVLQNYNALSSRFSVGAPVQGNGDVSNPSTGKIWMDRNLGATQVASSSTDANSYGDLYQWGRAADGHQIRASGTTSTFSTTDQPGNANFILGPNPPYDWRTTTNSNLWQGMNGVNNPCPTGYRLPTQAEWDAERLSWSSQNAAGAFASPLKLPMAGRRDASDGSVTQAGTHGWYWSSTTAYQGACNCNISKRLYFFNTGLNNTDDNGRSNGFAVRCIKD